MRITTTGRAAMAALLVFLGLAAGLGGGVCAQDADILVLVTAKGRHEIAVEIADTPQKKATGLMYRRTLGAGEGMLFPYEGETEITMWMKNTYIPLDMIFFRADGRIHRIERHTEPFSEAIIASRGPALAVLEINAGTADRLGLTDRDRAVHPIFAPATD